MAGRNTNYFNTHAQPTQDDTCMNSVVLRGERLETMDIEGIIYFPCRICNRLFQDEKLAIEHLRKCRPRIYLLSHEDLTYTRSGNEQRDPYEIIPEEMDFEDRIINNNSTELNRNESGNREWGKQFRRFNNNKSGLVGFNGKKRSSPRVFNKGSINIEDCTDKPKKNDVTPSSCNIEIEKHINEDISRVQDLELTQAVKEDEEANVTENPTPKTPSSTRGKRRKNSKKLSDQEIENRLKRISERLKNQKPVELKDERNVDDEEEERRAIEDRLSMLNKDSEICLFQGEDDFEEILQEEEQSSRTLGTDEENQRTHQEMNLVTQGIKDGLIQQCLSNMQLAGKEISASLLKFGEDNSLNSQIGYNGMMFIRQCSDGQLHGCRKCPEVFVTPIELLRHCRMKHTYPRIIMAPSEIKKLLKLKDRSHCPICQKPLSSTYKSIYIKHLQTHNGISDFECTICKKKFRRKDHMRAHEKRHII